MCIDEQDDKIYLFGGFYGKKDWDMPDFWCFNIASQTWLKILPQKQNEIWPGPRCCHCLAYDHFEKKVYILGGYNQQKILLK